MIYVILIFVLIVVIEGFVAYMSIGKNKKLTEDLNSMRLALANEILTRSKVEEANKIYVQKLATLSKGTDADRFAAAASIMSDGKAPSPKPDTKP